MTIEDLDRFDILGTSDNGPLLIAVDPGTLPDSQRLAALGRKLEVYQNALAHPEFQQQHPKWFQATVKVTCAVEPTDAMKAMQTLTIQHPQRGTVTIPVVYETVHPSLG